MASRANDETVEDNSKAIFLHATSILVKVVVGDDSEQVTYNLHRSLLIEKSGFFRGCLKPHFSEAAVGEVKLPGDRPCIFDWFVKWIYSGDIHSNTIFDIDFFEIYMLADKLMCSRLKDRSLDMVQEKYLKDRIEPPPLKVLFQTDGFLHKAGCPRDHQRSPEA